MSFAIDIGQGVVEIVTNGEAKEDRDDRAEVEKA